MIVRYVKSFCFKGGNYRKVDKFLNNKMIILIQTDKDSFEIYSVKKTLNAHKSNEIQINLTTNDEL